MYPLSDDRSLLRDFTVSGSDAAFGEIVSRHAGMVYSAALRQVGRADLAEEVTQAVFILLARKASRLPDGTVLPAWLYKATRYTALNALKMENRRRLHERRAAAMAADLRRQEALWDRLSPLLDEGIAHLKNKEREAVVLRFLERRSFADVGKTLGISEEAAQMRVGRAIEKLRSFFARRGIAVTSAALGGAVGVNAVQAAPMQLTQSITLGALGNAEHVCAHAIELADHAAKAMTLESVRFAAALAVMMVLTVVASTIAVNHLLSRPPEFWQWPAIHRPAERSDAEMDDGRLTPLRVGSRIEAWVYASK